MGSATLNIPKPEMPHVGTAAGVPQRFMHDAERLGSFFTEQVERHQQGRSHHIRRWMAARSIMAGIHEFDIDAAGGWVPLAQRNRRGHRKARTPLMMSRYRREMGRLTSNHVGATVIAVGTNAEDADAHYMIKRGQAVLDNWLEEVSAQRVYKRSVIYLLHFGLVGLERDIDPVGKKYLFTALPGCELFPIPYDAKSWEEMDGLIHVTFKPKQWLEAQDTRTELMTGQKPAIPLATLAGRQQIGLHVASRSLVCGYSLAGDHDEGAAVTRIWLKKGDTFPDGFSATMVGDRLVQYETRPDKALPEGVIPVEPVYYVETCEWSGTGLCPELVSPQLESNRQWDTVVKSARRNMPMCLVDSPGQVKMTDIRDTPDGKVPFRSQGFEPHRRPPVYPVPANQVGRDQLLALERTEFLADAAAGHESALISGRQEGRTEGGPATQMLSARADAPLEPILGDYAAAFTNTFRGVLRRSREIWPEERVLPLIGPEQTGQAIRITKEQIPTDEQVKIMPFPMVASGRSELLNVVFKLRSMQNTDGSFELNSREFRTALAALGLALPGIELIKPAERRIRWRIGRLINDGQKPAMPPLRMRYRQLDYENHDLAFELLREALLDDGFWSYSQQVQAVLVEELEYHQNHRAGLVNSGPDIFDDSQERHEIQQVDDHMHAVEQDETAAGLFQAGGMPIGEQ